MMAFTADDQLSPDAIKSRDQAENLDSSHKKDYRKTYLDLTSKVAKGADQGFGIELQIKQVETIEGVAKLHEPIAGGTNGTRKIVWEIC